VSLTEEPDRQAFPGHRGLIRSGGVPGNWLRGLFGEGDHDLWLPLSVYAHLRTPGSRVLLAAD
jgi:hypothetical protein